jgi:hypothetical protein
VSYYIVPTTPDAMATQIARGTDTKLSPINRRISCPYCQWTCTLPRRNALAVVAKLRGRLGEHLRAGHAEILRQELENRSTT